MALTTASRSHDQSRGGAVNGSRGAPGSGGQAGAEPHEPHDAPEGGARTDGPAEHRVPAARGEGAVAGPGAGTSAPERAQQDERREFDHAYQERDRDRAADAGTGGPSEEHGSAAAGEAERFAGPGPAATGRRPGPGDSAAGPAGADGPGTGGPGGPGAPAAGGQGQQETGPVPFTRGAPAGGGLSAAAAAAAGIPAGEGPARRKPRASGRRPSGRERHDEKITVYVSAEELMDLEHARLVLRGEHGLAVDRGRIVREAVAVVLADLEQRGEASILVRRLRGR